MKRSKLEADLCQKTHQSLHSVTGTLTALIPIVPEVHATLHLLCRTNVSAWMSHWTELSPSERSPPGQSPDPETQTWSVISANGSTSSVVAREGMCALACAPFPLVSKCVLFPQLFGADAGNAPAPECVSCLRIGLPSPQQSLVK